MNAKIQNITQKIKKNIPRGLDESNTKQGFILPVLDALGWNIFDIEEVTPEFSMEGGRVDYSLRNKAKNLVFIEVKKIGENLDKHQEQLLEYAFRIGVPLAALTNGIAWEFYLPTGEGTWTEHRFHTINLEIQEESQVIEYMEKYLLKENIVSGLALREARKMHESDAKNRV